MEIPNQLLTDEIRFVLLEKGGKKPFELGWQNKNINHNSVEFWEHIERGGNYGVMGGGDKNLIIIDFDNEKLQEELIKKLPKTFTVKTGSGLLHKYYFSDGSDSFKIWDEDLNTLADVQGIGKQVVGAGSIHPNGNEYEVVDDSEIAYLDYAEIKALLIPYDKKPKKEKIEFEKPVGDFQDEFIERIKSEISIEKVLSSFGVDTSQNPTACLFHASKGGKCLGFQRDVAHCFHCDGSWNIFSFVKEANKCDFKTALEYLADLGGLRGELEESRRKYLKSKQQEKESEYSDLRFDFISLLVSKERDKATELIVKFIEDNNYIYTTKDDIKSEMWIYKDGIYKPEGKSEIKELIRKVLGEVYNSNICNRIIEKIEADTFIDHDKFFQTNYLDEVPVENGILNIFTKQITPFNPEKVFFNKLPIKYDPDAICPNILQFLADVLKDVDDVQVVLELFGFCLLKEYRIEKAIMFVGKGRNGKSKTLELIKRFIGVENCCSVTLNALNENSFSVSELHGKMVNLAGDLSNDSLKETGMFKETVGRDVISAKRKFLRDLIFVNYAKHLFACNELPRVYDLSDGFWTKWVLLEFPYKFITQNEMDTLDDEEKVNKKILDPDIIEKITSPLEMSGLLNVALESLNRILENRDFSYSVGTKEIKELWIRQSDSFSAFCMDCVEENYNGEISKRDLRSAFFQYCKKHNLKGTSDKSIRITLENRYGVYDNQNFGDGSRYWKGISLK